MAATASTRATTVDHLGQHHMELRSQVSVGGGRSSDNQDTNSAVATAALNRSTVEHGDPPSVEAIFIRDKRRLEAGSSPSPRVQVYFLTTLMRNPSEPRSEHGIPTPLDEDHPDSQRQTRNSDGNQDMDDQPSDDDMAEEEVWHDLGLRDLDEEPPARKLSMREWQALKILAHHEWENKVRLLPRDLRSRLAAFKSSPEYTCAVRLQRVEPTPARLASFSLIRRVGRGSSPVGGG